MTTSASDSIVACNAHPMRAAVFYLVDRWQGWYRCPECNRKIRAANLARASRGFHVRSLLAPGEQQGR